MRRDAPLCLRATIGLGCALLSCVSGHAKTRVTGSVIRQLTQNSSIPVALEYADKESSSKSTKNQHSEASAVELAKAPPGGMEVPTFAGELSASIMNEELRNQIDQQYVQSMKSFMYFHGYASTGQDARGRFYGIDSDEEIAIRQSMARSVKSYMLSRGIPKFLLSREDTKHVGETYQAVVESTHVNVNLSTPDEKDTSQPWTLATGLNPLNLTSYARVSNEVWTLEAKYNIGKFRNIQKSDLRNMDFHATKKISDKYSAGSRYNLFHKHCTPYVTYSINQNLSTQLNTDIPFAATGGVINYVFTNASMSYLF